MTVRFGFNDLGGDLTPLLQEYRPAAWVTFDGGRARWLKSTFPEALVVYRHMPDGNNLHQRRPDAISWYHEARAACGSDNRIIIQCGNEPDAVNLDALTAWTCDVIDAADRDGGTVAVLGFSVCHPTPEDWRGPLLPVLRKLSDSRHYLLLHEYFVTYGGEWCIGQFRNAHTAADEIGITRPQIILGEYGYDLPGWKACQRERGLLDEQYAAVLVKAWNEVYAPAGVRTACVYAWGRGDVWQDYDVSDAGAFLTTLKAATLADPTPLNQNLPPDSGDVTGGHPTPTGNETDLEQLWRSHRELASEVARLKTENDEQRAALRAVLQQWLAAL